MPLPYHTAPLAAFLLLLVLTPAAAQAPPFDLDTGNAAAEHIIPFGLPAFSQEVSTTFGDATLVLRITASITNAWFDAIAPYHPTAVGVYSRLGRRPASESATNRNMNIAVIYASYRVASAFLPSRSADWRLMLTSVGLNPDDASTDVTTAVGLGNVAGAAVVEGRLRDGMNAVGDVGHAKPQYNPTPFRDYTGYAPVNTPHELANPSKWQPDVQRKGLGLYKAQEFVTPQYRCVEPYAYDDVTKSKYQFPPPVKSNHRRRTAYKGQADEVLDASAGLNDYRKMASELFDNKIMSLGVSFAVEAAVRGTSLFDFVRHDFAVNMAAFDAGIAVWNAKAQYDAVRPFSAIRYLYGERPVTAWGGAGKGTVSDLPGSQWASYLSVADHPEYPSASSCFCTAQAQAARRAFGDDVLHFEVPYAAGSSRIEPGLTPAAPVTVRWGNWTAFARECGDSRVWAGVHFPAAVEASRGLCSVFGDQAVEYVAKLVAGTAPLRMPAKSKCNSEGVFLDDCDDHGNHH